MSDVFNRETTRELIEGFVHILHKTVLKEIDADRLLVEVESDDKVRVKLMLPEKLLEKIKEVYLGMDTSAKITLLLSYGMALHDFEKSVKEYDVGMGNR